MGIGRGAATALHEIVIEEQSLRGRRYELIVSPVLAAGPQVAATGDSAFSLRYEKEAATGRELSAPSCSFCGGGGRI